MTLTNGFFRFKSISGRLAATGLALTLLGSVGGKSLAEDTPLIPRQLLFGNPEKASPEISPDGKQLAYLAPSEGVLNVWVAPIDAPTNAKVVTHDTKRGIRQFNWAYTNQNIIYLQDQGGNENWRIYSVDLGTGKTIELTPMDGVQARIVQASPQFPDELLIGLNNRNPAMHDIHRVNIRTGELKPVMMNDEGYLGYLTDEGFNVRFAFKMTADGGQEIFRRNKDKWEEFEKIPSEDSLTTRPLALDAAGTTLYMADSRGRNTAGLKQYDLVGGAAKWVAEDPKADISGGFMHPKTGALRAVSANYERTHWTVIDKSIQPDFDYLAKVTTGDFSVDSTSQDDQQWLVSYVMDNGPVRYYHYDRAKKDATLLFTARPALEGKPLAKMQPVVIKSRDGMDLVSYLTLPVGAEAGNPARAKQPLPLVLFVHGGPWARDSWGFNGTHQWLANRGYAVLSVNYRGSTGLGKAFVNAGDKEWAGKMHDDLLDAVNWAIQEKIADAKKVAIMGGSYGGYATLVGLTFTPDVFACGVDIVGPSSLLTLLNSIPPYWAPMVEMFTTRVGDHRTDEGKKLLTERSPLTRVDQIKKPLLIGQGANDPRVKQAEADQIVKALQEKHIPVTYILYPDEGHGFARPENRLSFNAVTEAFLGKVLGGRTEPIGDDFRNSTIKVVAGAEFVPGLQTTQKAE